MIVLSAKKRHGKDTVADYICATRSCYSKYALATPFKEALITFSNGLITRKMIMGDGYDRERPFFMNGGHVKEMFISILNHLGYYAARYTVDWEPISSKHLWSVRELMQTIGTDIGCNQVDKYIWMHAFVRAKQQTPNKLIVTDCRQQHEVDMMRKLRCQVIHIVNPLLPNTDEHITEQGLTIQSKDKVIYNVFDTSWTDAKKKESLITLHSTIEKVLNELEI